MYVVKTVFSSDDVSNGNESLEMADDDCAELIYLENMPSWDNYVLRYLVVCC